MRKTIYSIINHDFYYLFGAKIVLVLQLYVFIFHSVYTILGG